MFLSILSCNVRDLQSHISMVFLSGVLAQKTSTRTRPPATTPTGSSRPGNVLPLPSSPVLTPTQRMPQPSSGKASVRQAKPKCPIINCEVTFSHTEVYNIHIRSGPHSPCNPRVHLENGVLGLTTVSYLCPFCGELFKVCIHIL